jgi:oligopeptide transport system ATP-binding protein
MLMITHNLGIVARYADRVNVMYAGKIVERGTAREIYANRVIPTRVGSSARSPVWTSRAGRSSSPSLGSRPI